MCEGFVAVADGRGNLLCVEWERGGRERKGKEVGGAKKKLVEPKLI